jgi:transglutaminase-like putative cysteine protease
MLLRIFRRSAAFAVLVLTCVGAPGAARAAEAFPPITDAERALKSVEGAPNAPAVILFHKGEFQMLDPASHEVSSRLSVMERVKILSEEGKSQGEIEIAHSGYVRLSNFQGRTVLPDGTVVPLPANAKFERRISKSRNRYVTAVAFPSVSVGAILDYRYDLRFDSIFLIEPWYFANRLPTLLAEIVYLIPKSVTAQTWNRDPYGVGIKTERSDTVRGTKARVWAERIPPVPREPFGLPFEDLAAQITMIPTAAYTHSDQRRLFESWATTSDLLLEDYDKVLHADRGASRKAEELAKAAGKSKREQAAAIYRFVRDSIVTEEGGHVWVDPERTVSATLEKGRGDVLDKALLLTAMLEAIDVKARPVWANARGRGLVDLKLANPAWFEQALVAAEIDGKRVFLYPADASLGFGQLPSDLEGTIAVIPDRKKPEGVKLPEEPFDRNGRRAVLKLAVDGKGAVQGTGTLLLTGQHAAAQIGWKEDAEKTAAAWKEWLEKSYKDFAISDLKVNESAEEGKVEVRWAMAERAEEALGDQVSLEPSRPLGPSHQPFTGRVAERRSPVLFDYADRDEVELSLTWPAGWSVERRPQAVHQENDTGAFATEVEVKEAERTLTYKRRLDVTQKQILTLQGVERVRALFTATEKSDAEPLVLVLRAH